MLGPEVHGSAGPGRRLRKAHATDAESDSMRADEIESRIAFVSTVTPSHSGAWDGRQVFPKLTPRGPNTDAINARAKAK